MDAEAFQSLNVHRTDETSADNTSAEMMKGSHRKRKVAAIMPCLRHSSFCI
jgi:hypothetical protein